MEKRLAFALVICLAWIILSQTLFFPPPDPPVQTPGEGGQIDNTSSTGTESSGIPDGNVSEPVNRTDGGEGLPAEGDRFESTPQGAAQDLVMNTDIYQAVFSSQGAVLKSLKFKNYYTDSEVQGDEERMADPANWYEILGEIRENSYSCGLREVGVKDADALDQVIWAYVQDDSGSGGQELIFTYEAANGMVYRKIFAIMPGAYHLMVRLEVSNRDPKTDRKLNLVFDGPCGITDRGRASFTEGPMGLLYAGSRDAEADLIKMPAGKLEDGPYTWPRTQIALDYAGIADNYFALLLKPLEGKMIKNARFLILEDSQNAEAQALAFEEEHGGPPSAHKMQQIRNDCFTNVKSDFQLGCRVPAPGDSAIQEFLFFAGPKKTSLVQENPDYQIFYTLIEDSYGSMAWINKGLLAILEFFYSIFKNWGAAIIGLTFVVKFCLFPLNRVQQVSMQTYSEKMKKMKPKLDELKKKFKNNKKKFNEAQMTLMREEGVRPPLMGCLLIFFQFPIFIGLFQILRTSFELRHSPFFLWVQDLSMPDALPLPFTLPFLGASINVLPIAMTVAFYYQQKMMPKPDTSSDPNAAAMQKMMKFMPILFGVLFYGYASGLSLYWMTSNLISIFEYKVIRRKFPVGPQDTAKAGPPERVR